MDMPLTSKWWKAQINLDHDRKVEKRKFNSNNNNQIYIVADVYESLSFVVDRRNCSQHANDFIKRLKQS